jgi:uncharacterized membrane protein
MNRLNFFLLRLVHLVVYSLVSVVILVEEKKKKRRRKSSESLQVTIEGSIRIPAGFVA